MSLSNQTKQRLADEYVAYVIGAEPQQVVDLIMENYINYGTMPTPLEAKNILMDLKQIQNVLKS